MALQNCLRAVLLGPQRVKREGLNRQILPATRHFCFCCFLCSPGLFVSSSITTNGARVAADAFTNSVSGELMLDSSFLKDDSKSQTRRFNVRSYVYMLAGVTFVTATLCSQVLYVYLTSVIPRSTSTATSARCSRMNLSATPSTPQTPSRPQFVVTKASTTEKSDAICGG